MPEGLWRTPGGRLVRMLYRDGTNDWNVLTASLNEDEYRLPRNLHGVALDVGGYLGSVGIALALDNPDVVVLMVEPVPSNIEYIKGNIALNDVVDRVILIEGAVGREGETVNVNYGYRGHPAAEHHENVGNSDLVKLSDSHETISYDATTLASLVKFAGGDVIWMKVDIEGGEYVLFDGADASHIATITGEWHPYNGHVQSDIAALLPLHDVLFTGPMHGPGGFLATLR